MINHHLFCADLALRETGFGELLPGVEAIILDEAHQLPEIATHFFGRSLSGRQLTELARDTVVEQARDAADFPELRRRAEALATVEAVLREALGTAERRALWREVADQLAVQEAVSQLTEALERLREALKEAVAARQGPGELHRRGEDLVQRLAGVDRAKSNPGPGALVRNPWAWLHPEPDPARHCPNLPNPDGSTALRVDFHFGDAGGQGRSLSILRRGWG